MLSVDLSRMRWDRALAVNGLIAADAELWQGTELVLTRPVEVISRATLHRREESSCGAFGKPGWPITAVAA